MVMSQWTFLKGRNSGTAPGVQIRFKVLGTNAFFAHAAGRWWVVAFRAFIIVALIRAADLFVLTMWQFPPIAFSCSGQDCFSNWLWSEGLEAVKWGKYQQCYFSWCQEKGSSEDIITYSGSLFAATPEHCQQESTWMQIKLFFWTRTWRNITLF